MDAAVPADGLHAHCERCVKLARCAQAAAASGQRCPLIWCPTGCGHRLHACKLDEHRLLCPEERVPCINSEYGCPARLRRSQRAVHLASCAASVVLCMSEWSRWPQLTPAGHHERQPAPAEPLDEALARRDERLLASSLPPVAGRPRRSQLFPTMPLRLPGTYDCGQLAPQLRLDPDIVHERSSQPAGLQSSMCSQLAPAEPAVAQSTGVFGQHNFQHSLPPAALDTYHNNDCVHKLGRDLCRFCRGQPEPVRTRVRFSWQPGPADGRGRPTWQRVERTERVRERPGRYDLDAVLLRMKQQLLEEQEREQQLARAELTPPRLGLTVESIQRGQKRLRALYTFQCAQPLRRDEFADHFQLVHWTVHGGAGSWLQQHCPLAQYGCTHVVDRVYPCRPSQRFAVNEALGSVCVTSAMEAGREQHINAAADSGLCRLPFEVLQQIAVTLDPLSLNQLSLTCHLLRDVCATQLRRRGLVLLLWAPVKQNDTVVWRTVAKSWRFSYSVGPVRQLGLHAGAPLADHLSSCPLLEPCRAAEPFCLLPTDRLGAEGGLRLRRRLEALRASLDRS